MNIETTGGLITIYENHDSDLVIAIAKYKNGKNGEITTPTCVVIENKFLSEISKTINDILQK